MLGGLATGLRTRLPKLNTGFRKKQLLWEAGGTARGEPAICRPATPEVVTSHLLLCLASTADIGTDPGTNSIIPVVKLVASTR